MASVLPLNSRQNERFAVPPAPTSIAQNGMQNERSRSLDLGFLDSMDLDTLLKGVPDYREEMLPDVDEMFPEYVQGLEFGAAEGQQNGFANVLTRMDTADDGSLMPVLPQSTAAATFPLDGGLLATSEPAMPQILPGSMAALQASMTSTPQTAAASRVAQLDGVPQTLPIPLPEVTSPTTSAQPGMPTIPAPSPAPAAGTRGGQGTRSSGRGTRASAASSAASDDQLHHLQHEKTKRNAKQQLQNKQAQQRYRERRKQRFSELETALSALSDQMATKQYEMAGLQNQNVALQGKTQELTQALAAKDAEMAALRAQLAAVQNGSPQHSNEVNCGEAGTDGPSEPERALSSGCGTLSKEELSACRSQYDELVAEMRNVAERDNLRQVNPLGEGVATEVLGAVRALVSRGCHASQALDRRGGIQVLEIMGRDVEKLGIHTCAGERARMTRILGALNLATRQEEALLALRKQHLARLKGIYQSRQSLNMQAMGLMLPTPAKSDIHNRMTGGDPTLEGKMACMSIGSYLNCAKTTLQLDRVLDSLKENLREEQRAFMELKMVTLHRVLSPIQTLLFVVESYPGRPDALALANAVALKLGRATEGCPKAAELLRATMEEGNADSANDFSRPISLEVNGASDDSHKSDSCSLSNPCSPAFTEHS